MSALHYLKSEASVVETAAGLANQFRRHPSSPNEFPVHELKALGAAGLLGLTLPVDLGGMGIGSEAGSGTTLLSVLHEIGRANLPLGRVFEGHVNALLLLQRFGSRQQLIHTAKHVLQDDFVLGVWNTGPAGSPHLMRSEDGTYYMSGSKTFATGAARLQQSIVTASLPEGGWQMCLVPLTAEGVSISEETWAPLGMEASESFTIEFSRTPLAPEALIGEPGDYYAEPGFTSGAFRFCAVQLGGAKALFDDACELLRSSQTASSPVQKQRIGEMAVLLQSGRLWLSHAGVCLDGDGADQQHLSTQAQMMRIATEEICTRIIHLVQLTVGARSLTVPEPFARTLRDLQMYLRQAGFDQAYQTVADHALRNSANT
jgi:alkylation response protein AidB-like acyl-CoA dehydrogenase